MQTDKDFTDDISLIVKRLRRRQRYEREREYEQKKKGGIAFCSSENDYGFSQAAYRLWRQNEERKKSCQALYEALEDLKLIDPAGYRLIIEYYFEERVTLTEIGRKHGISKQACSKKIGKCLDTLKILVELHGLER